MKPDLEAQLPALKAQLKEDLDTVIAQGYKVIYIDETMFTRRAIKRAEWSRKGTNLSINNHLLNEKNYALLMGISKEEGVESWRIFPKSVDTEKFLKYLEMVREDNGKTKVCLFLDNLQVHKTRKAK